MIRIYENLEDARREVLGHRLATSFDLPEVRAKFAQEGIEAERMDAATSARFMEEENARWGQS